MPSIMKILLAILILFQLVAGPEGSYAASKEWFRTNGVVVINPPDAAPMSFVGLNGEPSGYIVDVWKKWASKTGIPVTFQFEQWPDTLEGIRTGKVDIHGGLFMNDERTAYMDFSSPYHLLPAALIVNLDKDADLDTIMESYTIGVLEKGYAEFYMSENHPETRIKKYPTSKMVAQGLVNGEIDAIIGDHPVMGYEVGKLGGGSKMLVKKILYKRELHGATTKGRTDLLEIMNEGLAAISKEEHEKMINRWFVTEPQERGWVGEIILAILILLTGFGTWLYFDRKEIRS